MVKAPKTRSAKTRSTTETEVEVRFIAEGKNSTRVELEHRRLDLYGARSHELLGIFNSEMGWQGLLAAFARSASAE